MNTQVSPFYNEPSKNFLWSFKPILNFIHFLGINLKPPKASQTLFWKIFSWFHFQLWFLFIVVPANCVGIFYMHARKKITLPIGVDFANISLFPVGIQLGFFIFQQKNIAVLWETLDQIGSKLRFKDEVYRRFRNLSIAGVAYIILSVIINVSLLYSKSEKDHVRNYVITMYAALPALFDFTPLLFGMFGSVALEGFRRINDEIRTLIDDDQPNSSMDPSFLDEWKSQHILLSDYVIQYNRMLNVPLLFEFVHIFLVLIRDLYFVIMGCSDCQSISWFVCSISQCLAVLLLMCYLSRGVKSEAGGIFSSLVRIQQTSPELQTKVDSLKVQVIQMVPVFSVFGLFEVDPQLILTMLGTTVTYFLILQGNQ